MYFTGLKGPIKDKLKNASELKDLMKDKCFLSVDSAIEFYKTGTVHPKYQQDI